MTEHPRPHLLIGFDGSDAAGHAIDLAGLLVPGARATVVTVRDTWKPLEHAAWARIGLPDAVLVPAAQTLEQEAAQAAAARAEQGRRRALWKSPFERSYAGEALDATPLDDVQLMVIDVELAFAADAERAASAGAALALDLGLDAQALPVRADLGAWRGLERTAEAERAAVVVVGSRGRGALAATLLGSVSSGLAHNAARPLLIARAPAAQCTPETAEATSTITHSATGATVAD